MVGHLNKSVYSLSFFLCEFKDAEHLKIKITTKNMKMYLLKEMKSWKEDKVRHWGGNGAMGVLAQELNGTCSKNHSHHLI